MLGLAGAFPRGASAFEVGTIARDFVDPDRASRTVPTDLYYPAAVPGSGVPVAEGVFPVVSFGHGFLIGADRYDYLADGLAEAGFIVALPRTEGGLFPSHGAFGLDLAFVLRAVGAEGDAPGSLFFGHVGGTSAVLGHSMGGGASFLAADSDPGITAIANLAAAETNPSAIEAASRLTIPALLLAGGEDCVTPPAQHQIPMYEALASDCRSLVTLIGGSHCQFAESGSICELGETGCGTPGLSRAEQHAAVLEMLVPWLRAQLEADTSAWEEFQARLLLGDVEVLQDCDVASAPDGAELPGPPGGAGTWPPEDGPRGIPSPLPYSLEVRPNPAGRLLWVRLPEQVPHVADGSDPNGALLPDGPGGSERVDLRAARSGIDRLDVVDAGGRVRMTREISIDTHEIRIDLSRARLPSGVYWVFVRGSEGIVAGREIRILR